MPGKIRWERQIHPYSNGDNGYLGKYIIFQCNWDTCGNKDKPYKLTCRLPGIKEYLGNFVSKDVAFFHAESVLVFWLENSGLQFLKPKLNRGV